MWERVEIRELSPFPSYIYVRFEYCIAVDNIFKSRKKMLKGKKKDIKKK